MTYPKDDLEFEEKSVSEVGNGSITFDDGVSLGCDSSAEPKVGMTARLYGRGLGYPVRGLFLNGREVFYRTKADWAEHDEIQRYGADAADWLKRWDEGKSVWSIEMGGLGPGYEQCIQIVTAEVVRFLVKEQPHGQDLIGNWKDKWSGEIDKALWANKGINDLGLSGAQADAGKNLGTRLYMEGPRKIMNTPEIKDRHIQVSRSFPVLA